jgi:hypothetical protein
MYVLATERSKWGEFSLALEGGPRMGGIKCSIIGRQRRQARIDGTLGVVGSIVRGWNGGTSTRNALDVGIGGAIVCDRWPSVDSRGIGHQDILDEGSLVVRIGYTMMRMAGICGQR